MGGTMRRILQYIAVCILAVLMLTACSSTNQSNRDMFQCKGTYIGDNSAVAEIIKKLPQNQSFKELSLQTKQKPYGMTVKYGDVKTKIKSDIVNNATYLFALIKNVNTITFQYPSEKYTVTRQQVQNWYGTDIRKILSEEQLKKLIQSLEKTPPTLKVASK
jgi:RNA polymerase-interacting CarD/CdnL/TRCF family regulator